MQPYHTILLMQVEEADLVSLRIVELLSRRGFSFSPATLLAIHKELFQDIFVNPIFRWGFFVRPITQSEPLF